ncbi:unnamed protein product [Triticum turgidum subsp. durum]|uniref:Uncharacterized protein n=1 Tax=Triticum turgidum subsp. durum TaxID=4567 RepID=A0A9R0VKZ8_TRITD|nr:unnamed protein product [Triticum turgidum subsp. durum]
MENGDETLVSPTAEAEKAAPNGGVAGEEVTLADAVHPAKSYAAVAANAEIEDLRAEVERLQALLDRKKADREADERQRQELTAEVETVRQAKLNLEKEVDALKASAAATTVEDREAAPDAGAPKEEGVAWQGMAAGAAAGAAITAAVVLIYLRLKR